MNSENIKKIMIVDDHPIMRAGIAQIIEQQDDLTVSSEVSSAREALNELKKEIPDLAIIDLSLKEISGIELIKEIKGKYGNIPILVLSMHSETIYAERVLRAGAKGYIMKHESSEKLLIAIRKVLKGKTYLSEVMSEIMLDKMSGSVLKNTEKNLIDNLSDRELEVFKLIGEGLKPHQIAEKLFLSVKTIETYYARLKQKFNFKSASELRKTAISWFQKQ
jgi:DNA-binding NarL/FixJ family response regulator